MKYFYANGGIHPLEESEEGLTLPQWAKAFSGDEGSDFRMLSDDENDEYTRQQGIKERGFDMSAARWAGNEQAMVENPATGQIELIVNTPQGPMLTSQADAAGIVGTPLMKPAEESTLSQWGDFLSTPPVALGLAAYGGANLFGTPGLGAGSEWAATAAADDAALGALFSGGEAAGGGALASIADGMGASNVASATSTLGDGVGADLAATASGANDAALGQYWNSIGAGASAGSGALGSVYGTLGDGVGADLAASTAAANEAAAGAGMTAAGAGDTAGTGLGGNLYNAATGAATAGSALSRLTGINPDALSVAGQIAGAGLGAYASNQQSGALTDMANKYLEYGAPSRARYEASMSPGFNPSSIPGYQGAVDNAMEATLRKLSTQGNPFGNPGGLIEANKSVVAGTALPALQEYQRLNAGTGGIASLNAAAPSTSAAATGANANIYNAIGYGIDQATAQPSTLDSLLKRLASKSTPNYGLA